MRDFECLLNYEGIGGVGVLNIYEVVMPTVVLVVEELAREREREVWSISSTCCDVDLEEQNVQIG